MTLPQTVFFSIFNFFYTNWPSLLYISRVAAKFFILKFSWHLSDIFKFVSSKTILKFRKTQNQNLTEICAIFEYFTGLRAVRSKLPSSFMHVTQTKLLKLFHQFAKNLFECIAKTLNNPKGLSLNLIFHLSEQWQRYNNYCVKCAGYIKSFKKIPVTYMKTMYAKFKKVFFGQNVGEEGPLLCTYATNIIKKCKTFMVLSAINSVWLYIVTKFSTITFYLTKLYVT